MAGQLGYLASQMPGALGHNPMAVNFGNAVPSAPPPKFLGFLGNIASALMAPGKAWNGVYSAVVDPSAPGGVDPYSSMMPDAGFLASMVSGGAAGVPPEADAMGMGFRSRNADGLYHRYTPKPNPDNGVGMMQFADDPYRTSSYGDYHHTYDGTGAVPASSVIDAARAAGFDDKFYNADALDPSDIVNTADGWDDMDAVTWLWDNVLEPRRWHAVDTNNGAVVFNPDLVKSLGRKEAD